jgi:hypothetical protein
VSCPRENEALEQFAAGEVSAHARECSRCGSLLAELEAATKRLAPDPNEFDDPELARDVATLIKLEKLPSRSPRRWAYVVAPIAVAALLALLFVKPDAEFQPRTASTIATDRWVSIELFSSREGETGYTKVESDIRADDALFFTVNHRPESPYRYAMILAFDDRGQIFWYHPAYTDASQNPISISLAPSSEPIALEEAVRHRLSPGWLRIVGLFSRKPLDVKSVEAVVMKTIAEQGGAARVERLPLEETGQHSFLLRVSR